MDGIAFLVIGIIGFLAYSFSTKNKEDEFFQEVATSLRLTYDKGGFWDPARITGSIDGCTIEIRKINRNKKDFFETTARKGAEIPSYINIGRETGFTKMQRMMGIKDIETGDPDFDDEIQLQAIYPQSLVAMLDDQTRKAILILASQSEFFNVINSAVTAAVQKKMDSAPLTVVGLAKYVVAVTVALANTESLVERFSKNIESDPLPRVRINNIRALTSHSTDKAAIDIILKKALDNSCLDVQVEAAKYLGKEGLEHLVHLLVSRGNNLKSYLLIDIVKILTEKRFTKSIPVLQQLYPHQGNEIRKNILRAFAVFGDTSLHSFLLVELEKNNPDFLEVLIDALGTCGEVDAVEKLYVIGNDRFNPFFRSRVKDAIARIQSRLGKVEKGWLSVSQLQEADGALSMADMAGEGALSTPLNTEKDKGN